MKQWLALLPFLAFASVSHAETWSMQSVTTSLYDEGGFSAVDFTDANNGWVVGSQTIQHTSNGGVSWGVQLSGSAHSFFGVEIVNANKGWVGPTTGRGSLSVLIGKVGQITVNATAAGVLIP